MTPFFTAFLLHRRSDPVRNNRALFMPMYAYPSRSATYTGRCHRQGIDVQRVLGDNLPHFRTDSVQQCRDSCRLQDRERPQN